MNTKLTADQFQELTFLDKCKYIVSLLINDNPEKKGIIVFDHDYFVFANKDFTIFDVEHREIFHGSEEYEPIYKLTREGEILKKI